MTYGCVDWGLLYSPVTREFMRGVKVSDEHGKLVVSECELVHTDKLSRFRGNGSGLFTL